MKKFGVLIMVLAFLATSAVPVFAEEDGGGWFSRRRSNDEDKPATSSYSSYSSSRSSSSTSAARVSGSKAAEDEVKGVSASLGTEDPEELKQRVESLTRLGKALRKLKESKGE